MKNLFIEVTDHADDGQPTGAIFINVNKISYINRHKHLKDYFYINMDTTCAIRYILCVKDDLKHDIFDGVY